MLKPMLRRLLGGSPTVLTQESPEKRARVAREDEALRESERYVAQHMASAQDLFERGPLLDFALAACSVEGLMLEFGVFRGASLRYIAERAGQPVHGFDSFEGLPEDWTDYQVKGRFSLGGKVPVFDDPAIRVHQGLFTESLPPFLKEHQGPARFVHIDCDLYSSTRDVLSLLSPRIVPGTVIVFDEYFNYPGWREHEYLAFREFTAANAVRYRYLAYASLHYSVAVQIVARGADAA